ncbi:MAG: zinc ribbon domain-containing protein [Candidatus Marinimicrobia bacterium]|nr:zinc ribbon domain-containing protein [Candidatus Neomarinimicrobiota bacterium]
MPVFEFRCKNCGNKFEELFLKYSDGNDKIECPQCHSKELEKLISADTVGKSGNDDFKLPKCSCGS